jgi:hypothetical protein
LRPDPEADVLDLLASELAVWVSAWLGEEEQARRTVVTGSRKHVEPLVLGVIRMRVCKGRAWTASQPVESTGD